MNKGNATIVSIIALVLVVALGVAYFGSTTQRGEKGDRGENGLAITGPQGPQGPQGEKGKIDQSILTSLQNVIRNVSDIVSKLPKSNLGATPGDDHYGAYWGVNDVRTYYTRIALNTATNTPCIIQSPVNATTTLVRGIYQLNTATSAAMFIDFGHDISTSRGGGGGYSTSTATLGTYNIVAISALPTLLASTTPNSAAGLATGDRVIFGPGDFFLVKSFGGANNGYYNHTGYCSAIFQEF